MKQYRPVSERSLHTIVAANDFPAFLTRVQFAASLSTADLQDLRELGEAAPARFMHLARALFVVYSAFRQNILQWWSANSMNQWFPIDSRIVRQFAMHAPLPKLYASGRGLLEFRLSDEQQGCIAFGLDAPNVFSAEDVAFTLGYDAKPSIGEPVTDVTVVNVGCLFVIDEGAGQDRYSWGPHGLISRFVE